MIANNTKIRQPEVIPTIACVESGSAKDQTNTLYHIATQTSLSYFTVSVVLESALYLIVYDITYILPICMLIMLISNNCPQEKTRFGVIEVVIMVEENCKTHVIRPSLSYNLKYLLVIENHNMLVL